MKKYFLSIVALAGMLFATSCQESLVEPQVGGPTTFTVQVPDQMGTKAGEDSYKLFVEVYSAEGDESYHRNEPIVMAVGTPTTVTLNLVANQAYDIIFWAQKNDVSYGVDDLSTVQMNANHHNSETGAAFYAVLNNYNPTQGKKDVKLTRPFAQLNLYTTNDVDYGKVNLVKSTITIEGVADKFNRVNQDGDDEIFGFGVGEGVGSTTYTYTSNILPTGTKTINSVEYQYVSMDYLAVPGNQNLVKVTAVIDVMDEKGNQSQITRIIEQVPVQMNYRTNIIGNLITSASDFKVEISEDWAGEDKTVEFREVSTADELIAAVNAGVEEIVLVADIELDQPLMFGAPASSLIARASSTETPSFILDLGNRTISNPNDYVIENYADLTIKADADGGLNGMGVIRSHKGKITIEGGTYTASSDWNTGTYQHILKAVNTEVVINDGIFDATIGGITNAMFNASEDGEITINGGTFKNVNGVIPQFAPYIFTYEKNGKLIINDGDFYGGWRFNGETATTDIYGGTFTVSYDGQSFHANSTHVLTIYGGVFSLENGGKLNPSNYVAEEYNAVATADGKSYVVLPEEEADDYDIVITDPTQLTKGVLDANEDILLQLSAGEYTIDLYMSESSDANLTIVGTKGTKVKFDRIQVRLALFQNFTIKNCEILRMPNKTWGMLVFGSGNKADGVYTIENCTFNGVGTQGIYINEDITGAKYNITNCTFNGDFGVQGAITIETNKDVNHIVKVKGCEFNDVLANHRIFLTTDDQSRPISYDFTLDTDLKATTDNELVMFLNLSNQVNVAKGNYKFPTSSIKEGQTIICEEGTVFEGQSSLDIKGSTVIGATFENEDGSSVRNTINGVFENCTFTGSNALRYCYAGENVIFRNCVFDGDVYGVHFDGGANDATFENCVFSGFNAFGGALTQLNLIDCTFKPLGNSSYNGINMWGNTKLENCNFEFDGAHTEWIDACNNGKILEFNGCEVNGEPLSIDRVGDYGEGNIIIIDGKYYVKTATSFLKVCTDVLTDGSKNVTIELANDIDLAGIEWPAVKTAAAFVLDGKGYSIKNLTTSAVEDHGFYSTAMFTSTRKATTIKNLVVENATVTGKGGDNSHGAVLVACNYAALNIEGVTVKNSTVSNCDRSSVITTYLYFTTATVKNCVVERCTVNSIGTAGALLGMNNSHNFEATGNTVKNTTISSSEGSNKAGILIGTWQDAGTLTESNNVVENSKAINAGTETNNNIGRHA